MANLIITNLCNANCEYCFAADSRMRSLRVDRRQMDETELRSWLSFVMAAGIRDLRLLGGEPTIHPQFAEFVRIGSEMGCTVSVFSNGVMPAAAVEALEALSPEECSVVVNMNAAIHEKDVPIRTRALTRLGTRVIPGVTLTSADFSLQPYITTIETYGLNRAIRIGIANPTWKGNNRALSPKRYTAVGQALWEQSYLTARHGITLDADCGFVRCMFGNRFDQLVANGFHYISNCTPVLDFCPGGTILPCFGLSNLLMANRMDFADAKVAYDWFEAQLQPLRRIGIYPECTECPYFGTIECSGGCLSARLRRLHPLHGEEDRQ